MDYERIEPQVWEPHEQRWRRCEAHMEREPGRLQLRLLLRPSEGICQVPFEETEDAVTVLILVCGPVIPGEEFIDCPTHIFLNEPLGDRVVLDVVQGGRPVRYRNIYEELERKLRLDSAPHD